ncbi:MAG: class I SAM-dependent RNA methyltransferase [Gemmatimonadaceae bacterium]|nr:class I SAM-dependent RNA methyltransferase [Gemmatimonadaceae bacterium]MCW5825314.1 class I SAM-dependent RNA methyltransferase [Gemmatimonadaceae bacterium]
MSQTTLDIASISAGGDGVARHDGLVVFTPRTAPGDRVVADVTVQGRVGRGRLLRVEREGPSRVAPSCAHYEAPDRCGGCQWQHVDLTVQRDAKRAMLRDAFQRIAKREIPLPRIHAAEPWRYRRSLTLAMRRHADGSWYAGLRAFDDPEAVFELEDCLITAEPVLAAWREVLAAAEHLPDEPRLRGTIRVIEGRAHFVLEGGREWPAISEFLDGVPGLAAVWWQAEGKRRRLVADRRPAGEPGASFAQVNPEMAALLRRAVVDRVMTQQPRRVVDAFSGSGDVAAALDAQGVQVVAIEADEEASEYAATRLTAAGRGAAAAGAPGSRAIAARVEDVLGAHLPADVVILNPPRSGVDAKVTAALVKSPPKAIIYVSCDPATLARDVGRLPGWAVQDIECYDLFPQTAHVETLCELRPELQG